MARIILIIFLLELIHPENAKSQDYRSLRINNKIPEISFGTILNDPSGKLRTTDLKGKLVILDFWNIHCANCIATMPKMDSLQKQFDDHIQIIYITKNTETEVNRLFSRIKIKRPNIPFIVNDSLLNILFPHNGDPLHVWISQEGVVYAITFDYSTNGKTIQEYLSGGRPKLQRRWDYGINQNYPLLSEVNSGLLELTKSYSVLFQGLEEYSSENLLYIEKDTPNRHPIFLKAVNAPLLMLYGAAFNKDIYGFDVNTFNLQVNNRIILQVKDSSAFFPPTDPMQLPEWTKKNLISYEIKVPATSRNGLFAWMQQDIERAFPYIAKIEKMDMKCLSLNWLSPDKCKEMNNTSNPALPSSIAYENDNSITIQNLPAPLFVQQLIYANQGIKTPIITGIDDSIKLSMRLKSDFSDIKSLNNKLKQYGLVLLEEKTEITVLTIKDK